MYISHLVHPFIDYFHLLIIVNNASVNVGIQHLVKCCSIHRFLDAPLMILTCSRVKSLRFRATQSKTSSQCSCGSHEVTESDKPLYHQGFLLIPGHVQCCLPGGGLLLVFLSSFLISCLSDPEILGLLADWFPLFLEINSTDEERWRPLFSTKDLAAPFPRGHRASLSSYICLTQVSS